jgi:hypothetical protein
VPGTSRPPSPRRRCLEGSRFQTARGHRPGGARPGRFAVKLPIGCVDRCNIKGCFEARVKTTGCLCGSGSQAGCWPTNRVITYQRSFWCADLHSRFKLGSRAEPSNGCGGGREASGARVQPRVVDKVREGVVMGGCRVR